MIKVKGAETRRRPWIILVGPMASGLTYGEEGGGGSEHEQAEGAKEAEAGVRGACAKEWGCLWKLKRLEADAPKSLQKEPAPLTP